MRYNSMELSICQAAAGPLGPVEAIAKIDVVKHKELESTTSCLISE